MSIQAINEYHNKVHKIFLFSGVNHEQAIKNEFAILINSYCKDKNLLLIQEKTIKNQQGKNIRPDGTLSNILVDLGFWESKANVDLDKEVTNKINAGYPLSNTLFQDDQKAVLFQNGERCFETPLDNKEDLDKLLTQFVSFKSKEVKEFYDAVENFKYSLPDILETINKEIALAETSNPQFKKARLHFLNICEKSINPNISINDINEMLLQHILTEEIFNSIFDNADFHRDNNIAKELYKLEETFFKGKTKKDTLSKVQTYYAAIKRRAASIIDHHEKQAFLKAFYEDFYKIYNPKAADRMGIVYTPHEIVKFQIESIDYLLEKHFKKTLAHEGVKILDPCVGTGTYICELIDYLPPKDLEKKFNQDIYCNELGLLAYYIANLNIEYTYQQKIGEYIEFNNLCWVDTLDNTGFNFKGTNTELFGLSIENTDRIKVQNNQQISVIIGNPPYNANQQNENDNNKNREYKEIDKRIKDTYIEESTAQKTKQYDMYKRFIRWASDRISENGIICFIINRSFIDKKQDDGFRKCIEKEFDFTYIIDLGGDMRLNTDSNDNVFGITIGVAILFLIKKKGD
jgi:predicted helicase